MVDSAALRQRRKRAHRQGNHSLCRASHCSLAGQVERDDVTGLRDAIEAEFRDDPARLAIARSHVEQAAQRGQPGVAAVAALDKMLEAKRSGRYASPIPPEGRCASPTRRSRWRGG